MLINAKDMLNDALQNKYAVCQFNINNLEWTKFILEECEINKAPVILGVSEGAVKYMGGYNTVVNIVKGLMTDLNINIPVALHLDHGSSLENCKKAIDAGFTSVMIDASKFEIEENIKITKEVTDYAKLHNVSVEAEVGHIGGEEDGIIADIYYATLNDSIKITNETGIDFLAPALGSVHGPYKGEPNLNFERMQEIKEAINIPLVLHGGSGIPENLIKQAIQTGVCKININTDLQIVWTNSVREFIKNNSNVYDPRKIIKSGEIDFKNEVLNKLNLTNSCNRYVTHK